MNIARTAVFRVDVARMFAASRRMSLWGWMLASGGFFFLAIGLLSSAYGVFAIAIHTSDGDARDFAAQALVVVICITPLALALVLLGVGVTCLLRASRLRELRSLVYGRESVTTGELAARTRRSEREMLALLVRAQKHDAAWRTS